MELSLELQKEYFFKVTLVFTEQSGRKNIIETVKAFNSERAIVQVLFNHREKLIDFLTLRTKRLE
ncbi:MAG: hypothetical protein AB7V16_13210 [Vulcanibacillus sp.]